jgi:hypothetical protein
MLVQLLWSMFEKTGDINYYLKYKELQDLNSKAKEQEIKEEEPVVL